MTITIHVGDCRKVLKTLDAGSVQCVVTSPPYWGLRDYGLPPLIWGGDEDCQHLWGEELSHSKGTGGHNPKQDSNVGSWQEDGTTSGSFCHHCAAWRGSLGLEPTMELYVEHLVEIFREVRRVLCSDGVAFVNLGDSYASAFSCARRNVIGEGSPSSDVDRPNRLVNGLKEKDLCGVPWRVAFALQADGWWLRSDIIWAKPNPMPESVTDRPTKAHEYVFLLSKSARYFYDADAVREPVKPESVVRCRAGFMGNDPERDAANNYGDGFMRGEGYELSGRNRRTVWTIATSPFPDAHFATFPPALVEPCVKAGTSEKGCCPACGAPWERVVEKSRSFESGSGRSGNMPTGKNGPALQGGGETLDIRRGPVVHTDTIGWRPGCSCGEDVDSGALDPNTGAGIDVRKPYDPVPCTVLDPFGGAGTVGLVADRLQRDAILIELNESYARMSEERIKKDAPMFVDVRVSVSEVASTKAA